MELVFGETLHKYQEPEAVEEQPGDEGKPKDLGKYYTEVPTADILGKEGVEYILVVFTAEYCPPC